MKKVSGVCYLEDCDVGGTAALDQSIGPFTYSVDCEHRSRNIGLIHWCTYSGECDMQVEDHKSEIKRASEYTNFWRR